MSQNLVCFTLRWFGFSRIRLGKHFYLKCVILRRQRQWFQTGEIRAPFLVSSQTLLVIWKKPEQCPDNKSPSLGFRYVSVKRDSNTSPSSQDRVSLWMGDASPALLVMEHWCCGDANCHTALPHATLRPRNLQVCSCACRILLVVQSVQITGRGPNHLLNHLSLFSQ